MTRDEVVRELIDGPSRAYVPFPELEVVERPDFARLTCSLFPTGGFNGISRTKVSAAEVDALIDSTLADYRRRGLRFRWSVMPDCTPSDLAARLAARGLVASEVVAMSLPLSAGHGSAMAREVSEPDAFTRVMAEGWGAPFEALLHVNRAVLADPARRQRLFVSFVDGEPAGAAGMMVFERSAYLLGGVVLERFRRRGAYRALIEARLAVAHAAGCGLATSHANAKTSAPLLAQWGFTEQFRFLSFSDP